MAAVFGPLWIPCLVLAILGIAFLIGELCMPGFGVSGICGILCLIAVCVMQFLSNTTGTAVLVAVVLGVILIATGVLLMHSLKKGLLFRSPIVLKDQIDVEAVKPSTGDLSALVGKTGTVVTPLRPSGTVLIDGERYSVVTQATFVEKGSTVTVLSVDGPRIIVE